MDLNAYVNDFKYGRSLKEKCFVCKKKLNSEYFTLPNTDDTNTHDQTRAHIRENRMCSKICMNIVTVKMNAEDRI